MLTLSLCLALAAPQGQSNAPVVINEFVYDDSSTDSREFVELYNRSGGTVDIGDWVLDSEDPFGPNTPITIPTGTMLPAGGYWVMGDSAGGVPNVNQNVSSGTWENGEDSLTLRDDNGRIIDTLIYEANKSVWNATLAEGEGIWGNLTSIDGVETSWSRIRDGWDTDNNGCDFVLTRQTPGTANDLSALPYGDNFDATAAGTSAAGWSGSFVLPTVEDPTVAGGANPNAIPASPQGGNAALFWDPAGGGNSNALLHEVSGDVAFDAWVYIDATTEATGEIETWSIGFGTTATFFNSPDPSGALGFTANGNTGVSWTYQSTDSSVTMYFVDHNDGGWGPNAMTPPTVVGSIAVVAGSNDGWQRIRLERFGGTVVGSFGGSAGCADGTTFSTAAVCAGPTTLYVGYREGVSDNSTVRPVTLDDVSVRSHTGVVSTYGSAAPTTVATPGIGTNGPPTNGWQGFRITMSDLIPGSGNVLLFGVVQINPGTSLVPFGGQPGSELLVSPLLSFNVVADGNGDASLPAPLPCDPNGLGFSLFWQTATVDPNLAFPLPIGHTPGLETTIGN